MPTYLRLALWFTTPLNFGGALAMSPLWPSAWVPAGVPIAHPLHAWILASFVFGMGLAYGWMAWTGRPDRMVLALAAYGKLCFAFALFGQAAFGELPSMAAASGVPDLVLGLVFAGYLASTRDDSGHSGADPIA